MTEQQPPCIPEAPSQLEIDSLGAGNEGDFLLESPEFKAGLAYATLDNLLQKWMEYNPDVTTEDVDEALQNFRDAIAHRDGDISSQVE